jgi:glycerol-3-phosphate dehydrogenase
MNNAVALGSSYLTRTEIESFKIENNKIIYAVARNKTGGKTI